MPTHLFGRSAASASRRCASCSIASDCLFVPPVRPAGEGAPRRVPRPHQGGQPWEGATGYHRSERRGPSAQAAAAATCGAFGVAQIGTLDQLEGGGDPSYPRADGRSPERRGPAMGGAAPSPPSPPPGDGQAGAATSAHGRITTRPRRRSAAAATATTAVVSSRTHSAARVSRRRAVTSSDRIDSGSGTRHLCRASGAIGCGDPPRRHEEANSDTAHRWRRYGSNRAPLGRSGGRSTWAVSSSPSSPK